MTQLAEPKGDDEPATPGPPAGAEDARGAGPGWLSQRVRRPAVAIVTLSWVPLLASALAVILSVASIYISTREPEVVMILPDVVRLVGGRESGASYAYLQPAFVSTGVNDRIEVIRDMTLTAAPADGAPAARMEWKQQLSLEADEQGALTYRYVADAIPLLVGPRSAASPLSLFQAPEGWFFGEGTLRFTLEAERVVASAPLRATFDVRIEAADLAVLDAPGPERFLSFPVE